MQNRTQKNKKSSDKGPKGADFRDILAQKAGIVEEELLKITATRANIHPKLKQAMEYTLQAPGKKIRGVLVLLCCRLTAGRATCIARGAAAAIEMVHAYSLVHDDLPAMDDDDMRRGRPSCHKAFDEATAILTGDALLTLAFEVLTDNGRYSNPDRAVRLVQSLAEAAGPEGMVAGQMADIENQNIKNKDNTADQLEKLQYIHLNKTARMFACAAEMGAISGLADGRRRKCLRQFGLALGQCFQIADDILDISATSEHLGKTAGKDVAQGKLTYPAIIGLDESRKLAERLTRRAVDALDTFDSRADILRHLALELLERTK